MSNDIEIGANNSTPTIADLIEENERLKAELEISQVNEKRAFWWAAEQVHIVFDSHILPAWEAWKKSPNRKIKQ